MGDVAWKTGVLADLRGKGGGEMLKVCSGVLRSSDGMEHRSWDKCSNKEARITNCGVATQAACLLGGGGMVEGKDDYITPLTACYCRKIKTPNISRYYNYFETRNMPRIVDCGGNLFGISGRMLYRFSGPSLVTVIVVGSDKGNGWIDTHRLRFSGAHIPVLGVFQPFSISPLELGVDQQEGADPYCKQNLKSSEAKQANSIERDT